MKFAKPFAPLALALGCTFAIASSVVAQKPDWPAIDRTLGRKGAVLPGGVVKYGFPRSDLTVTMNGTTLKPAFALGGWVAFQDLGTGRTVVMGDLVLTEHEVAPVMAALQHGGIEQTALHNHLLGEMPRVMYMHVHAEGDPAKIAQTLRAALGATGTPMTVSPPPAAAAVDLDTAAIARAIGVSGSVNGGVFQLGVPRRDPVHEGGRAIPPSMGVATGINFQPTGGGNAVVTGDFVLVASEVNHVIRALQAGGITVTALHSHMLDEEPRLFFMHFWGKGNASLLAGVLGKALDQMAVRRASTP